MKNSPCWWNWNRPCKANWNPLLENWSKTLSALDMQLSICETEYFFRADPQFIWHNSSKTQIVYVVVGQYSECIIRISQYSINSTYKSPVWINSTHSCYRCFTGKRATVAGFRNMAVFKMNESSVIAGFGDKPIMFFKMLKHSPPHNMSFVRAYSSWVFLRLHVYDVLTFRA